MSIATSASIAVGPRYFLPFSSYLGEVWSTGDQVMRDGTRTGIPQQRGTIEGNVRYVRYMGEKRAELRRVNERVNRTEKEGVKERVKVREGERGRGRERNTERERERGRERERERE